MSAFGRKPTLKLLNIPLNTFQLESIIYVPDELEVIAKGPLGDLDLQFCINLILETS